MPSGHLVAGRIKQSARRPASLQVGALKCFAARSAHVWGQQQGSMDCSPLRDCSHRSRFSSAQWLVPLSLSRVRLFACGISLVAVGVLNTPAAWTAFPPKLKVSCSHSLLGPCGLSAWSAFRRHANRLQSADCVEKLPRTGRGHVFKGVSPLTLSEIVDSGPFYEVDFSISAGRPAAFEFFNTVGQLRTFADIHHFQADDELRSLPPHE